MIPGSMQGIVALCCGRAICEASYFESWRYENCLRRLVLGAWRHTSAGFSCLLPAPRLFRSSISHTVWAAAWISGRLAFAYWRWMASRCCGLRGAGRGHVPSSGVWHEAAYVVLGFSLMLCVLGWPRAWIGLTSNIAVAVALLTATRFGWAPAPEAKRVRARTTVNRCPKGNRQMRQS